MTLQELIDWHAFHAKEYERSSESMRESAKEKRSSPYSMATKISFANHHKTISEFHRSAHALLIGEKDALLPPARCLIINGPEPRHIEGFVLAPYERVYILDAPNPDHEKGNG